MTTEGEHQDYSLPRYQLRHSRLSVRKQPNVCSQDELLAVDGAGQSRWAETTLQCGASPRVVKRRPQVVHHTQLHQYHTNHYYTCLRHSNQMALTKAEVRIVTGNKGLDHDTFLYF